MELLSVEEFQRRYNTELDKEIIELSNSCKIYRSYQTLLEKMMDEYDFKIREPEEAKKMLFEMVTSFSGFESLVNNTYSMVQKMLDKEIDESNEKSKRELIARCIGLWLVYELSVDLRLEKQYKDKAWFDAFGRE